MSLFCFRNTCHHALLCIVTALLFVFCISIPFSQADGQLKVGVYNFEPLLFFDSKGTEGLFIDVLEYIANKERIKIQYIPGSWNECLNRLKRGEIDLLASIAYSDERAQYLDFSKEYLFLDWGIVYSKNKSDIQTVFDLEGKSIAVLKGSIYTEGLINILEQFDIKSKLIEKDEYSQVFEDISNGAVDAGINAMVYGTRLQGKYGIERTNIFFSPVKIRFAVQKNHNQSILTTLDKYISILKSDKTSIYYESYDKWMGFYAENSNSWKWLLRLSVIIGFLLLIFLSFSILLKWQVTKKTFELLSLNQVLKENQKSLELSEKRYRSLIERQTDFVCRFLPGGNIVYVNDVYCNFFHKEKSDLIGSSWQPLTVDDDFEMIEKKLSKLSLANPTVTVENRVFSGEGKIHWIHFINTAIFDDNGTLIEIQSVGRDVTERVKIEKELKDSESQLRTLIRAIPDLVWLKDSHGTYRACNSRLEELFGKTEKDIIGKTDYDFMDKELADFFRMHDKIAAEKGKASINEEEVIFANDGHHEILETIKTPIYKSDGQLFGILGIGRDITERKKNEAEVMSRELLLNEMGRIARIGGWEHDLITREATWTKETYNIAEIDSGPIPGPDDHLNFYPPEYRSILEEAYGRAIKIGEKFDLELRCSTAKGRSIWARVMGSPEFKDGICIKVKGTFQDITEQKKLEERLKQAEKMEAIGNLAGGVAHDYNNMLSIIIGYTELSLEKVNPGDQLHTDLNEILVAARRSTDITRQLLAFARKQTISPRVIDLNDIIESMLKMLRRLIGENIDLIWIPESELWPLKIDPSQVDQILANLCINARDAIDGVGKIIIETGMIRFDEAYCIDHEGSVPGSYLLISVSDSGQGIAPEMMSKIFDPFFTTKGLGKGTGLGLATVYGIVKQNNGFINVYSDPENGTTIKIYLPRHEGQQVEPTSERIFEFPLSRGETILLVEDDMSLLKLGNRILNDLGYTVLSATSPNEAVRIAETHAGKINLLITDVVMPEMNGRELSEKLQCRYPGLKILFMSGYTASIIADRGVLEEGVCFISKPFSKKSMAVKIREVLSPIKDSDNGY